MRGSEMDDLEERTQSVRDVATGLPFLAAILLVSPLIVAFSAPIRIFGMPLIVVYLFSVWLAIIAIAFIVARRLERAERVQTEDDIGTAEP